ncbi:hypothetical protein ACJX0J_012864, partial [Zea mays]
GTELTVCAKVGSAYWAQQNNEGDLITINILRVTAFTFEEDDNGVLKKDIGEYLCQIAPAQTHEFVMKTHWTFVIVIITRGFLIFSHTLILTCAAAVGTVVVFQISCFSFNNFDDISFLYEFTTHV